VLQISREEVRGSTLVIFQDYSPATVHLDRGIRAKAISAPLQKACEGCSGSANYCVIAIHRGAAPYIRS